MAKPRIFISSTYYDLKHIRNSLEVFIDDLGYEAVLFENGDIPFHHDQPLDESCYGEIHNCHMFVLIIGGRYGSSTSDSKKTKQKELEAAYEQYNSITKKEYETAREKDIPIFIFVEKNVLAEYQTYKDNRENDTIKYAHADSVNIYRLLDDILSQGRNNFVRDFEKFDDISTWLKDQWAGIFFDFLSRQKSETSLKDLSAQISDLSNISAVLREYTESMMRKIQPENFQKIISEQSKKLRASKIKRFANEGLITHLIEVSQGATDPAKLFKAFEETSTLEDFLKKSNLDKEFINNFLETYKDVAQRDYDRLYKRYIQDPDFETDLDDE